MKTNGIYTRETAKAVPGSALPTHRQTSSHREAERRAARIAASVGIDHKIERAYVMRESDENATSELENLIDYTLRPYAEDPDVAEFLGHGIAFAQKGRAAEELRARYNARTITGGYSGRKVIGWIIEIGSSLFVVSLYSAAKTNDKETNDFTDALSGLIERHAIEHLFTGPFSRLVRSKDHARRLADACRKAGTTIYSYGRIPSKLDTKTGRDFFDRMVDEAVYDYDLTVDRLTRGAHSKLLDGQWVKAEEALPSLGCYKFTEQTPGARKTNATIVPDVTKLDLVVDFLTWGASDLTDYEIAQRLAKKHGWGSEVLRRRKQNPTATVMDARNPDLVVKHLWRHLDLFETGKYLYEQRVANSSETVHYDAPLRDIGGVKFLSVELDCHHELLPAGQWVDPSVIAECRRRRLIERKAKNTGRAASRHVARKPLTGFDAWTVDTYDYKIAAMHHAPYNLVRRPSVESYDETGRRLGWRVQECELVATMDAAELHQALAKSLTEALGTSGIQWQREIAPKVKHTGANVETLEKELAAVNKAAKRARTLYGVAAEIYAEDETEANRAALKEAAKEKAEAEQHVKNVEAELAAASIAIPAPALITTAELHVNEVVAALALLARTTDKADAALNLSLQDLFVELRAETTEDLARVNVTVYLAIRTDEGPVVLGPVTCSVLNRRRQVKSAARREGILDRCFRDGMTIAEIVADLRFTTEYKATRAIHDELKKLNIIPSIGLRVAAMDCPIPEVRAVIYAMIEEARTGEPFRVPANIDPAFAAHVRSVYSKDDGWVYSWALDTQETQRRAIAAAQAGGEDGLDWNLFYRDVLPSITSLSPRIVGEDLVRGKRRRGSNATPLAPVFERSENWNGRATDRRVWVRHCPFCGTRTLDHPVRVPEVPGGLICSTCRRSPELPTVVFPDGYAKNWAGPRNKVRESGQSGAGGTVEV